MAVLVEAISVVAKAIAINSRMEGGWPKFKNLCPNSTLCADEEVARVGFMHPNDVKMFVSLLEHAGLIYVRDGRAVDLVVVDQQRGPMVYCDWVEFGPLTLNTGQIINACRLKGSRLMQVVTPDAWTFDSSLSKAFGFAPGEGSTLEITRGNNGIDELTTPLSESGMFIARPFRA